MLIHSVTPPHLLVPPAEIPERSYKTLDGSFLEGTDTPQGFQLSRIHSTDPSLYLKQDLSPGSIYRE